MNVESYSYTVIATVLGMLVVFSSLSGLSLLMVVLKAAFGDRAAGTARRAAGGTPTGIAAGRPPGGPAGRAAPEPVAARRPAGGKKPVGRSVADEDRQPPPWLAAAVVAYLVGAEGEGPTAEPWLPEFNHFDPWLVFRGSRGPTKAE